MIFPDSTREFRFPKFYDTRRFFPFIFVDTQVNLRGETVQVLCNLAVGIKRLRIAKIIHQFGELLRHFIRISGSFVLVLLPLLNILFYKPPFSQFMDFLWFQIPAILLFLLINIIVKFRTFKEQQPSFLLLRCYRSN